MNNNEQGAVRQSRILRLLVHLLLLLSFCTASADTPPHEAKSQTHYVYIIHSPDNTLNLNIIQRLSDTLKKKHSDISVLGVTPEEKINKVTNETDMIIGIGREGMESADTDYPENKKLFIATDPNKYKLHTEKNKNDAILYMTQPYCRQIRFIKLLNRKWKTISVLSSKEKPIDSKAIQQCANKYDIKIYMVSITSEGDITNKIKHALHHSDVLLALPDSNIYNSKTVKNILLTSYRYRKPVIAFSKNFVNAGALAAIYSDTEKIAQSASRLLEQHFYTDTKLESINYPDAFDIDINKQVFRALDISVPDIDTLKMTLEQKESDIPGRLQ